MKLLSIFLTLLSLFLGGCSEKKEPEIIVVEGRAKVNIIPNNCKIEMKITSKDKLYSSTSESLSRQQKILINYFESKKISEKRLKTSKYEINKCEQFNDSGEKLIFNGFEGNLTILLHLEDDFNRLGEIIDGLKELNLDMSLDLFYNVRYRDIQTIKDSLVKLSLEDAIHKAEIIAQNTGNQIVKVNRVRYGNNLKYLNLEEGINSASYLMFNKLKEEDDARAITFNPNPEDIEIDESLVVYYEIQKK
ncbi:MAG: SIMPL domain-containing protein [Cytophagales bacterium]